MRGLTPTLLVMSFAAPAVADEHFEAKVRPLLVEHCFACHSAKAQKLKGGLALDTRDGLRRGGDGGPLLDLATPSKSLLLKVLKYDSDIQMPPKGKLPDALIADVEKWIAAGAPDPRMAESTQAATNPWDATFAERKQQWAWQPLKVVSPPVAEGEWQANPIDRFIRAKQATLGLEPTIEADRATLLRRVTYLLTGLPPTAQEIEAFLKDASPTAYEKVVDRLLASPAFGERMATNWLDVMRYAETHGSEGDPAVPFAWRYRDYVIRAFNTDLPFDRFIREQIAGDLLEPRVNADERINESILGTGHFRMVEHGFQPIDSLDEQVKTVDNQIDVISKAFLGVTVSCARCHDHKFDAISQRDYYALYGILANSRPGQVTIDDPALFRQVRQDLAAAKATVKRELAALWLVEAESIAKKLPGSASPAVAKDADERDRLATRLAEIERQALSAVAKPARPTGPRPLAAWRFEGDARDAVGSLHGDLREGAEVRNGKLVLDGKGAHVRTVALQAPLREKTLEAWVRLGQLDQRGSGVLSVETRGGGVFDAIVLGEKQPGHWIAGSNNFRRTQSVDGTAETASGEFVHLAITYTTTGEIQLYRKGELYGKPYKAAGEDNPVVFEAGDSHLLIGLRHGNKGPLAGEIEEARLYDRALTRDEVKASFAAGANLVSEEALAAALPDPLRRERAAIKDSLAKLRGKTQPQEENTLLANAASDTAHPLHPWATLRGLRGEKLAAAWKSQAEKRAQEVVERREFNRTNVTPLWNLADANDYARWNTHGLGLPGAPASPGDFALEGNGERVVTAILPAGVYTNLLSAKLNGVLASPTFKLPAKAVSIRMIGDLGGGVRIIPDNYPLGNNGTYPQRRPTGGPMTWGRLDTTYRAGSDAYVEFATVDDVTNARLYKTGPKSLEGRSYVGVAQIVAHDNDLTPKEEVLGSLVVLRQPAPATEADLASRYAAALRGVILAWREGSMTDADAVFLDEFVRQGLLSNSIASLMGPARSAVEAYRKVDASVPQARRAPGLLEAAGRDAPVFVRGNHRSPGVPVPRGFLPALGGKPYSTTATGRLELANDLARADNPLVPRVLVNRLWHWTFGRGLVATPDNFGKLGEPPTHPELLDFLADRFVRDGRSVKSLLRLLVTSRTFRLASTATQGALATDPANIWLARSRVRRLEAEAIRDGLLSAAGELEPTMFGPPVRDGALDSGRRSVYVAVRRNAPHPLLEVFDKPAPLSCRGQRDVTTLPAQSLALLNSAFAADLSKRWGAKLAASQDTPESRLRQIWLATLGREPTSDELLRLRRSLDDSASEARSSLADPQPWQDLVQSVICLKETIYLK